MVTVWTLCHVQPASLSLNVMVMWVSVSKYSTSGRTLVPLVRNDRMQKTMLNSLCPVPMYICGAGPRIAEESHEQSQGLSSISNAHHMMFGA